LVVLYLYVHDPREAFAYPSVRSVATAARVAERYLECALVQIASLRLHDADCDVALATNIAERPPLGRRSAELVAKIESFDVAILPTPYVHRPGDGDPTYLSSRYVLDAIVKAAAGQPESRPMWMTDLDCVWVDPPKTFAALPASGEVGCVLIEYPPDWDTVGFGDHGRTRVAIGELAGEMGGSGGIADWVGGEVLAGTAGTLLDLVAAAERLDTRLALQQRHLPTEEQILSLAAALGEVHVRDLSPVARRVMTGRGHKATPIRDPLSLGLWHLPGEKGLSLRRAARETLRGRTERLRRDLDDPGLLARRFNVRGTGLGRRVRDGGWALAQRLRSALHERFASRESG
jgi:hypothetical protein